MFHISLRIPEEVYQAVRSHLLPRLFTAEEMAFMYIRDESEKPKHTFSYLEWYPVPPSGFLSRSRFHLELTDEMRALVIKRAHDLGASLVEFHSHAGSRPAEFSPSDLFGFNEFVPHIWWRLKGRPYLAVVVARTTFDGLAWIDDSRAPQRIDGIFVGQEFLVPTKLSSFEYDDYE